MTIRELGLLVVLFLQCTSLYADGQQEEQGASEPKAVLVAKEAWTKKDFTYQWPVFSQDGKQIGIGCRDGMIRILNASDGTEKHAWKESKRIGSGPIMVFHPNGKQLAVHNDGSSELKLLDIEKAAEIWKFTPHSVPTASFAFHPSGSLIATCGSDRGIGANVKLWDTKTPELKQTILGASSTGAARAVAFSSDSNMIAFLVPRSQNKTIVYDLDLWSKKHGIVAQTIKSAFAGSIAWIWFSKDSKQVLTADTKQAQLWLVETGKLIRRIPNLDETSRTLSRSYSPEADLLATKYSGSDPQAKGVESRLTPGLSGFFEEACRGRFTTCHYG